MNFDRFQGPCLFLPGIGVVGGDRRPRTTLVLVSLETPGSDLHAPQRIGPWLFQMVGWKHAKVLPSGHHLIRLCLKQKPSESRLAGTTVGCRFNLGQTWGRSVSPLHYTVCFSCP